MKFSLYNILRTRTLEISAILRILNRRRVANLFTTILYYYIGRIKGKANFNHQPFAISIEPTSICNLKCSECPTGINDLKRARGNITLAEFKRVISMLPKELMYLNLYIQGEPTMHPQFAEMVECASQKKLYTSTSTNGHFITPGIASNIVKAGLTRIIFSIDGVTQKSYEQYRRGGKLDKAIEGLSNIVNAKKEQNTDFPIVIMQFLVFQHNENEIYEAKSLAKQLGVDKLEIKTAQFNNYKNTTVNPPLNNKYSRYEQKHQNKLKGKMLNTCWRQWHSAVITWDGQITQCCYDKDAEYAYANLRNISFNEAWNNKQNRNFKQAILSDKASFKMCHNCPEGRAK